MYSSVSNEILTQSLEKRYAHRGEDIRLIVISHIIPLYNQTKHIMADHNFHNEFLNGGEDKFEQRYWEMHSAYHFLQMGFRIARKKAGPDLRIELDDRTIWLECVAPNISSDVIEYYRVEKLNRGMYFAPDIFALRWTQAIDEKIKKFQRYIKLGIVRTSDICVIAVNSSLLGSLGMTGKSDYPIPIDVLFGAGAEFAVIDRNSMKIVDQGYKRETVIMKKNGSKVSKAFFLDSNASHVSAIIGSTATPEWQSPFLAVYNPFALNPLTPGRLGAAYEYYAEDRDGQLELRSERRAS